MVQRVLTCPMCGHLIDTASESACQSCPINNGCNMICCPNCGYTTIDHTRAHFAGRLGRMAGKFRRDGGRGFGRRHGFGKRRHRRHAFFLSLLDVPRGAEADVVRFAEALSLEKREHLLAYGVRPGKRLRVLRHLPVTVVQVDFTEIALEHDLARLVEVRLESQTT